MDRQAGALQDLIKARIDTLTHFLQRLAEPTGCVVENIARPGRGLYDYRWRVSIGEPPVKLGNLSLRGHEAGLSDDKRQETLGRRLRDLLRLRGI